MQESFTSFWLSRVALIALFLYVSSAIRIWQLSPGTLTNRIAALLCLDLAAWAFQAAISYAADDPAITVALSRVLSWSWTLFPVLALHLSIEVTRSPRWVLEGTRRLVALAVLYASALLIYWLIAGPLLEGAERRAGYWSVNIREGLGYTVFSLHYLLLNVVAMILVFRARLRATSSREKSTLGIILVTHAISLFGGFITDTVLAAMGVDFPKVGVLWGSVWAIGLRVAMARFDFLAPFSARDTGLLMDKFISHSMDGIVVCDASDTVIYWNEPLAAMTGLSQVDTIGRSLPSVLPWAYPATTTTSQPASQTSGLREFDIRHADGTLRWLQMSSFVIPSQEGDIRAMILRDISSEKQAAAKELDRLFRQSHSQKMEALGALAGGIAHDFNNTLGGIVGAVSLIRARLETETGSLDLSRELEVISRSAQRAAGSVRGLMAFASDAPRREARFRLADAVSHVTELANKSLHRCVRIVVDPIDDSAMTIGDAPQVEQLLLNLVINAEHAMTIMRPTGEPHGGTLRVSMARAEPDEAFVSGHPSVRPIPYWALSVDDEGVGMDAATLARVFDPFFTTKGTDQGSGLGLAMAHIIATQHGGFMDAASRPGEGTTMTVYLPAVSA
ncbi:MAG: PAS domain S-box protein [Spirochaetales bacterium]|nr:PAS domain S-box protein [Spirochaetales bacterium]